MREREKERVRERSERKGRIGKATERPPKYWRPIYLSKKKKEEKHPQSKQYNLNPQTNKQKIKNKNKQTPPKNHNNKNQNKNNIRKHPIQHPLSLPTPQTNKNNKSITTITPPTGQNNKRNTDTTQDTLFVFINS